ncbi:hypothetical protein HDU98_007301 [Podochytrium sp. JEL0797]|nr:hypothetical protein HDU98_007301 [Podochytrium sp. JEL0797]
MIDILSFLFQSPSVDPAQYFEPVKTNSDSFASVHSALCCIRLWFAKLVLSAFGVAILEVEAMGQQRVQIESFVEFVWNMETLGRLKELYVRVFALAEKGEEVSSRFLALMRVSLGANAGLNATHKLRREFTSLYTDLSLCVADLLSSDSCLSLEFKDIVLAMILLPLTSPYFTSASKLRQLCLKNLDLFVKAVVQNECFNEAGLNLILDGDVVLPGFGIQFVGKRGSALRIMIRNPIGLEYLRRENLLDALLRACLKEYLKIQKH